MTLEDALGRYGEKTRESYNRKADRKIERFSGKVNRDLESFTNKQERRVLKKADSIGQSPMKKAIVHAATGLMFAASLYMIGDSVPRYVHDMEYGQGASHAAQTLQVPVERIEDALYEKRGEGSYLHPDDSVRRFYSGDVRIYSGD